MICCFSGGESNFSIVEDNRGKMLDLILDLLLDYILIINLY